MLMSRRRVFWLVFLSSLIVFVAGPILVMMSCTGWNAGSMAVQSCTPDFAFIRALADGFYGFMLVASFALGLPILIYLFLIWLFSFIAALLIAWACGMPPRKPKA